MIVVGSTRDSLQRRAHGREYTSEPDRCGTVPPRHRQPTWPPSIQPASVTDPADLFAFTSPGATAQRREAPPAGEVSPGGRIRFHVAGATRRSRRAAAAGRPEEVRTQDRLHGQGRPEVGGAASSRSEPASRERSAYGRPGAPVTAVGAVRAARRVNGRRG